jgi:phosphatidylcholine synthase
LATAWLAHLYTASGAVIAFAATRAVFSGDYRQAFLWLALQVVVDATDGAFARWARVSERLPWFNGAKLDDIIDYLCYVFIPALIVWRAALVPAALMELVVAAVLLSSAFGFNRDDAKTEDHFFTGFPSYWNIVVAYMVIGGWRPGVNAAMLLVLAALVFVPIRYVYPSRMPVLRGSTNVLAGVWGLLLVAMIWWYPDVPGTVFWGSLAFPVYYLTLSLWLHASPRSHDAR